MSKELQSLMDHYGVQTPSLTFTGTPHPGAAPVAPAAPAAPAAPQAPVVGPFRIFRRIFDRMKANEEQEKQNISGPFSSIFRALRGPQQPAAPAAPGTPAAASQVPFEQQMAQYNQRLAAHNADMAKFQDQSARHNAALQSRSLYQQPQFSAMMMPGMPGVGGVQAPQGFARGGLAGMAEAYDLPNPTALPSIMPNMMDELPEQPAAALPDMPQAPMMLAAAPQAAAPAPAAPSAPAPQASAMQDMLRKYLGPQQSVYAEELKAARAAAGRETEAFNKILERALAANTDSAPSKAELYFRLASAFGSPTKTGNFTENLSLANKEMAEDAKARRESAKADRATRLQLAITGQKAKMDSAKDDLTTLRTLTGEEMKDQRALTTKVLEQYIKSGEPESAAGKQAKDEGLRPGTPEYQKRVKEIAETNVEQKLAQINSTIATMGVQQAQLALAQNKFDFQQQQAAKLTPAEVKLKTETEDSLSGIKSAMSALNEAYNLNPNTFDNALKDRGVRFALENTKSDDPRVVATRRLENLLRSQALSKLKDTFPGAISNDERKALEALQGLDAKSLKERAEIMKAAYKALQSASARQQKRLNEINQGLYRDTQSGGLDGN